MKEDHGRYICNVESMGIWPEGRDCGEHYSGWKRTGVNNWRRVSAASTRRRESRKMCLTPETDEADLQEEGREKI